MSADFYDPNKNTPGGTPAGGPPNGPATPVPPVPGQSGGPDPAAGPEPAARRWSPTVVGPFQAPPVQPPPLPSGPPVQDESLAPLRIPTAPQGEDAAPDRMRIGLWGAPRSGKTTYLAALPIAALQFQRHGRGNWVMSGMTPDAGRFLSDSVHSLASERVFPQATTDLNTMSWAFQGEEPGSGLMRRSREPSFVLETLDAPGESYQPGHPYHERVLDQLTKSQGLIYLFDPLGDAEKDNESLKFFYSTLSELSTRVRDSGGQHRGRLPHHVSVCVAKFDHPDVFRPSVEAGWVTQDSVGSQLPRVPAEQSQGYFQWLCDEFRGATARLVRDGLANFFHPDRISYYATSAIGFRLNPQHIFDYRNYANVDTLGGQPRICTSPVPINVLEPLTDMERRIRTDRGGRRGRRR
ncbi:hypothetical protein OG223_45225 [Streptomyces sp. NBC_01478]|uniref:hypothetical protein n=1 Tax=Streptomyces sp. NBC_01478 TaxID=2903882 RepID=UPI002E2FFAB4|nr:hypothetical protein [Streptomyces sp. NBC_01478]